MNYIFIIVLLLLIIPVVLLIRGIFSKSLLTTGQFAGAVCLTVAFTIGMFILRLMIKDEGDTVAPELGYFLTWFINGWGFLYLNCIVLLGFFILRFKSKRHDDPI